MLTYMTKPGVLALNGNLKFSLEPDLREISFRRQSTGHVAFYRADGRRILLTDPTGHPLHECEWSDPGDGPVRLVTARLFLDWEQWVGIKPKGLVNRITLDLSARPGWEQVSRQDLRIMASQIMQVPLSEVEFFYSDDDLLIEATGKASIQQSKDAFYVLKDGSFDGAAFMSCMSAMHWDQIDYLPVVELFKSLLPGTGSATFELIRGLYDDQNPDGLTALTYRGIPTYPSEGAYGLFSNFFSPTHSTGQPPFPIFMDPSRSHEISWLPNTDPPFRFLYPQENLCLTVRRGVPQKVTVANDTTGLPFVVPNANGFAPLGKMLTIKGNSLVLQDHQFQQEITIQPEWGITNAVTPPKTGVSSPAWTVLFPEGAPVVKPTEAFSAVLLYPEGEAIVPEWSSQPFVADHLDDVIEQNKHLASHRAGSTSVLVHGFDTTIGTCLVTDHPCRHTILYSHLAHAQKQAQFLWNVLARADRLDQLTNFKLLPLSTHAESAYQEVYNLIYRWIPYEWYADPYQLTNCLTQISRGLNRGGMAFLAGPELLAQCMRGLPLQILFGEEVQGLQTFQMHRSILPKAQLHPELFVWAFLKS